MNRAIFLFLILLATPATLFGQKETSSKMDSLLHRIENAEKPSEKAASTIRLSIFYDRQGKREQADSTIRKALSIAKKGEATHQLITSYLQLGVFHIHDPKKDTALFYLNKAKELLDTSDRHFQKGSLYNNLAMIHIQQGKYHKALRFAERSLESREAYGDSIQIAHSYLQLGNIYDDLSKYPEALEAYIEAERIYRKEDYIPGLVNTLNNIALVHGRSDNTEARIEYLKKNVELMESKGHQKLNGGYINLANALSDNEEYDKARSYYEQAIDSSNASGNLYNQGLGYFNLGDMYLKIGEPQKGLENIQKGLERFEKIGFKVGVLHAYLGIGRAYTKLGQPQKALVFLKKGAALAGSVGTINIKMDAHKYLADAYESSGEFRKAYEAHKEFLRFKDSTMSLEKQKKMTELETKYKTEKKELEIANLQKAQKLKDIKIAKRNEELEKETTQKIAFAGGFGLMLILAFLIYRGYRQKKKNNQTLEEKNRTILNQKQEVEKQKEIVEEKNDQVVDSITYAQRLQKAILPTDTFIQEQLPESFIHFQPKDIVSGDFYWVDAIGPRVYFTAADCTGHGVPGAMVSVVGANGLERCVREFHLRSPSSILDKLADIVENTFESTEQEVKDGMDIALCCWDKENNTLTFAGANNPLYLITQEPDGREENRKTMTNGSWTLIEIPPDKQPVGKHSGRKAFTETTLDLKKGDAIYLFSDGFPDQFGGKNGKKFKYKQFKELLLSLQDRSIPDQKKNLEKAFKDWSEGYEQVDDVCIFGIRF